MKGCRPLAENEVTRALAHAIEPRERALLLLGIRTGLRISELLSLKVSDIIGPNGEALDRVYIQRRHVKGSTEGRSIVLHNEAKEAIKALVIAEKMRNEWFLFKSRKGHNRPITTCQAWRILKDLYTRAGITGHVATHTMRKTFADRIHRASGRDIFQTQRALGHKSLDNTAAYLSFDQAELDALVKGAK